MEYSNIYFGKTFNDLTFNDLEQFFTEEREENETIEFKSFHQQSTFDTNIQNVIRGISAFLNSDGGILIWGAPAGRKIGGRKEEVFIGDLAPLNTLKEKDSLINLISGRITPLPVGIALKILEKDRQYLYVFEVQPSPYKPHQYNDRYFVRLDGQSKPAPHYLIDALFKKITFPDVNGFIKFERFSHAERTYHLNFSVMITNFSKFQNEENASFQLTAFPGNMNSSARELGGNYYSKEYGVLHYGRPVRHNFNIIIHENELASHDYKVQFTLSFGGKYSPAKISNYTLDLLNKQATRNAKDTNKLIIRSKLEENLLISDYQERIGKSKDTFIKDIIEREDIGQVEREDD